MLVRSFIIIILSTSLSCQLVKSQSQYFTVYNYTVSDGLPSSEIYKAYQDHEGFLWFATDNGVAKFDGYEIQTFHMKEGLSDPVVFGFYEDDKDRLWFRSYSGKLSYYEKNAVHQYEKTKSKEYFRLQLPYSLYVGSNDDIWMSGNGEIVKIDSAGKVFPRVPEDNAVEIWPMDKTFLAAMRARRHIKYVIVDGHRFDLVRDAGYFFNQIHTAVWNGHLYFSLGAELFRYDTTAITKIKEASTPIIHLGRDLENNFWVGYMQHGVQRFSEETFATPWSPDFLKGKSVTSALMDKEGGLWFTTLESGVYFVPNLSIEKLQIDPAFKNDSKIRAVASVGNRVFIGDMEGNMLALDAVSEKVIETRKFERSILSLFVDSRKRIWNGTGHGSYIMDTTMAVAKALPFATVAFIEVHERIFLMGGGVWKSVSLEGENIYKRDWQAVYRSMIYHDSLLYTAMRVGLHICDINGNFLNKPEKFSDLKISGFQSLNDSTLLIATLGSGFYLYNSRTKASKAFDSKTSFHADNIYSTMVEGDRLWLGTEKGIAITPLRALLTRSPKFDFLTQRNGLAGNKIEFLIKAKNKVWAFANEGISIIPLNFTQFANKKPQFYFKELIVNGQGVSERNALFLKHNENNIQLAYGFISFNNQNILTRYRLNKTAAWTNADSRRLTFSAMSPGDYEFQLQYSLDNINWISAPPLQISISKPWWMEWYTYVASVCLLFIVGYIYFRHQRSIYRQRNHYLSIITEHQERLIQSEVATRERERNRISKELHDRVGTNLTAIKLMVTQLLRSHKEPLAEEIEEQFQVALREIKDIIYGLTPPGLERYGLFTGLKNYIGKLNKSTPLKISLKTFGNDSTNYDLNIMLFRVLQELITNSIKHASAKNINIHINAFEDMLNIVYEDDGIGFAYDPASSGLGLDSVESRIRSVNGTLRFDSGSFGVSYTIDIPINHNEKVS